MNLLKRIVIALLAASMLLTTLAACKQSEKGNGDETEAPVTTEAPKKVEVSPVIAQQNFKQVAIDYVKLMTKKYYSVKTGKLKTTPTGNDAVAWGVGVFAEALTETYRLAPEDATIKEAYIKMLDVTIQRYRATLTVGPKRDKYIYYNSSAGNTGDYYFDDDEWIALVYLEAYQLLDNEQYLTWAEEILDLVWYGWEKGGSAGVPWKNEGSGVSGPLSCSNGPAVVAYTIHYELTKNENSLEHAKAIYDWMRKNMLESNLYKDGPGNGWKANYNQGTMIYGGSMLYKLTGDETYLKDTQKTVKTAFGNGFKIAGVNKYTDFDNDIDNPWMNGWLVRGFMKYFEVDPSKKTNYLDAAAAVMQNALALQQKNGYIPVDFGTKKPSEIDYDVVKQGGIPVLFALLATWQQTWNGVEY